MGLMVSSNNPGCATLPGARSASHPFEGRYYSYNFLLGASQQNLINSDQDSLSQLKQLVSNFTLSQSCVPNTLLDHSIVVMLGSLADLPVCESTANLCRSFVPLIGVRLKQVNSTLDIF